MFNVGADLVIGDGPMMAHVSVIGKYKYWDRFRHFEHLSLNVVVSPTAKSMPTYTDSLGDKINLSSHL